MSVLFLRQYHDGDHSRDDRGRGRDHARVNVNLTSIDFHDHDHALEFLANHDWLEKNLPLR